MLSTLLLENTNLRRDIRYYDNGMDVLRNFSQHLDRSIFMLIGSILVVYDTVVECHIHKHSHIIVHNHNGTIHTHIITHEHLDSDKKHRHIHYSKEHRSAHLKGI